MRSVSLAPNGKNRGILNSSCLNILARSDNSDNSDIKKCQVSPILQSDQLLECHMSECPTHSSLQVCRYMITCVLVT